MRSSMVMLPSKDQILVEQFETFKDSLGESVYNDEFTSIQSDTPNKELKEKWKNFHWKRIPDIKLEGDPRIFGDSI